MKYFYSQDGKNQQGPVTLDGLRAAGISASTMVWYDGLPQWTPARDLPELADLFAPSGAGDPPIAIPSNGPFSSGEHFPNAASTPAPSYITYQTPTAQSATNGLALTSMIMGIVSVVMVPCLWFLSFPVAILAVIFGHLGRGQIRRGKGGGAGLALTGLITGYIALALSVAVVILMVTMVWITPTPTPARPLTPMPTMPTFPNPATQPFRVPAVPQPGSP